VPATGHRARPAHHAARPARLTFHPVTTSGGSHRQNSTPATSPHPRAESKPGITEHGVARGGHRGRSGISRGRPACILEPRRLN
jgi:hypothetical protein